MQEKLSASWEGLDFDKNDILFGALVKCACEEERKKALAEAQAEETKEETAQEIRSRQLLEKYLRRQSRIRVLKKGYRAVQKAAVFLVVVFVGFTYAVVNVEAVNQAVVGWLTEVHQTHTELLIGVDYSPIDYSNVHMNWLPEGLTLDSTNADQGSYRLMYNGKSIGIISLSNQTSNITLNTEEAQTAYLELPNYDTVFTVERNDAKAIVASNGQIVISISIVHADEYSLSVGEMIQILQNIDY